MKTILNSEIKNYLSGKSSDEERVHFERKLKSDPFLVDAVDGYKLFPEMLNQNVHLPARSGNLTATLVVFLVGLAWIGLWWLNQKSNIQNQTTEIEHANTHIHQQRVTPAIEPIQKIQPVSIPLSEPFKELGEIGALNYMQKVLSINLSSVDLELNQSFRSPVNRNKITYIHNLKVIVLDTLKRFPSLVIPEHLPAMWESEQQLKGNKSIYEPPVKTRHYMDLPLLLFEKGKYKQSLIELEKVGTRLPGNLNIAFYRALCFYNLEDYKSALIHFRKTQRIPFQGFYEESRWYEALCLEKTDQLSEAKSIYSEMVERDGFYAIRAASRLAILLQTE